MKLSLSNGIFSKQTLDENVGAISRLGFSNIEFNMKSVEENDEAAVYTAKKLINAYGLQCLTLHAASLHVKTEQEIPWALYYGKVSADFAHILSAPVMVVHSNVSRQLPKNLRRKFLKEIFGALNPYAKSLGVRLALENLSYASSGYGKNVAELEEILRIIGDGSMGVTLDFCHAEATGQTFQLLEKYKNKLFNIHISDRAHNPFIQETPNLIRFLTKLRQYDYLGPLTMELNLKCTPKEVQGTKVVLEKLLL